jgi:hypothetical protein
LGLTSRCFGGWVGVLHLIVNSAVADGGIIVKNDTQRVKIRKAPLKQIIKLFRQVEVGEVDS